MNNVIPDEMTQKEEVPDSQPATWLTRPEVDAKPIKEPPKRFIGGILNEAQDQVPTVEEILQQAGPPPPTNLRRRMYGDQEVRMDEQQIRQARMAHQKQAASSPPSANTQESGDGLPQRFLEAVDFAVQTDPLARKRMDRQQVSAESYFGISLPTLRDPRVHRVVIGEALAQVGVNFNRISTPWQTKILETMHDFVENLVADGRFVNAAHRLGEMSGGVWGVDVQGFGVLMALGGFSVTATLLDLE